MTAVLRACAVVFTAVQALLANAESLRCNGHSASDGDSRVSVLFKCGQPLLRDSYCAPVYDTQALYSVRDPVARGIVTCEPVEEWLYERGPGHLAAIVRFRSGVVQSIRYGRVPQ